jgi:phage repressor protein C with HTH and peptisase S24 domain
VLGGPGASRPEVTIPLIGLAQAGKGGYFDDAGFPVGGGWDEVGFPTVKDENAYALEITGDSMEPVYRDGDIIIVSPNSPVRRGDRVVVKTRDGQVLAKILKRQTMHNVELGSFNPAHEVISLATDEIEWIARILWAAQ